MKLLFASILAGAAIALGYHQLSGGLNSDDVPGDITAFQLAVGDREHHRNLKVRPVRFYAMADAPYSQTEMENLPLQLSLLDPTADFTIHLGDMKDRTPVCTRAPYKELAEVLKTAPTPTFIIPGDNCYYDCVNWQEAFEWWNDDLSRLNENWPITKFNIRRQNARPENFAITWQRVLFISIHSLWWSGKIKNKAHWSRIENDNVDWTRTQLATFAHTGLVDAVVVLGHAFPVPTLYPKYFDFISDEAEKLPNMPFLYLQGNSHRFAQDTPFRAKNILRTVIDRGGIADPLLVTVDTSLDNPFVVQRRKLSGL